MSKHSNIIKNKNLYKLNLSQVIDKLGSLYGNMNKKNDLLIFYTCGYCIEIA